MASGLIIISMCFLYKVILVLLGLNQGLRVSCKEECFLKLAGILRILLV